MKEDPREMQLLCCSNAKPPSSSSSSHDDPPPPISLDLQLSMSLKPLKLSTQVLRCYNYNNNNNNDCIRHDDDDVEALKWEAREQIRLAAMEKAYAERVMELTRREMELAQSDFLRARALWDRAREELDRAHRMRVKATCTTSTKDISNNSISMEIITCLSCTHKFTPN